MKARVTIMPKSGVLDPQGKAIEGALTGLGFAGIAEIRQGKLIEVTVNETDPAKARAAIEDMCKKLLANPVMESFSIELIG
jgi:phosphoribosylformylglycinamidine synthase